MARGHRSVEKRRKRPCHCLVNQVEQFVAIQVEVRSERMTRHSEKGRIWAARARSPLVGSKTHRLIGSVVSHYRPLLSHYR